MAGTRAGLGKGLEALLPEPLVDAAAAPPAPANLPVETLHRGKHQPRTRIAEEGIEELAQSIRAQGVIEPVVVRPRAAGGYEIIAGERRWRAAQRAGLAAVPAVVREVDDRQALAMALIENIQREDLNPLEEAYALKGLLTEYALTHEQLADAVGKSRAAVSNLLRLLNLAPAVREHLAEGALEMGHARALLPLPSNAQAAIAGRVVARRLSVRQTEALVRQLLANADAPDQQPATDADTRALERNLSEQLCARTSIIGSKGGKGRIVIRYGSLQELEGILSRIGPRAERNGETTAG